MSRPTVVALPLPAGRDALPGLDLLACRVVYAAAPLKTGMMCSP